MLDTIKSALGIRKPPVPDTEATARLLAELEAEHARLQASYEHAQKQLQPAEGDYYRASVAFDANGQTVFVDSLSEITARVLDVEAKITAARAELAAGEHRTALADALTRGRERARTPRTALASTAHESTVKAAADATKVLSSAVDANARCASELEAASAAEKAALAAYDADSSDKHWKAVEASRSRLDRAKRDLKNGEARAKQARTEATESCRAASAAQAAAMVAEIQGVFAPDVIREVLAVGDRLEALAKLVHARLTDAKITHAQAVAVAREAGAEPPPPPPGIGLTKEALLEALAAHWMAHRVAQGDMPEVHIAASGAPGRFAFGERVAAGRTALFGRYVFKLAGEFGPEHAERAAEAVALSEVKS